MGMILVVGSLNGAEWYWFARISMLPSIEDLEPFERAFAQFDALVSPASPTD